MTYNFSVNGGIPRKMDGTHYIIRVKNEKVYNRYLNILTQLAWNYCSSHK